MNMMDNNVQAADENQDKNITPASTDKAPGEAAADMPKNKTEVPKIQAKPKASVWTEVTDQTLEQLKEKAKATYGKLSSGSSDKEKTSGQK
jgi:hypothetical protein